MRRVLSFCFCFFAIFAYLFWENGINIRTFSFDFCLPIPSKKEIRDSIFFLRFSTTLKIEFQVLFSFFLFPHNFGKQNSNCHFLFSVFRFRTYWTTEFELTFVIYLNRENVETRTIDNRPGSHDYVFGGNKMSLMKSLSAVLLLRKITVMKTFSR